MREDHGWIADYEGVPGTHNAVFAGRECEVFTEVVLSTQGARYLWRVWPASPSFRPLKCDYVDSLERAKSMAEHVARNY